MSAAAARSAPDPAPGPAWDNLPLPALLTGPDLRITALNEQAEAWLNLSRRAALGASIKGDDALAQRVEFNPPLTELAAHVSRGHDMLVQPRARVVLNPRGPEPIVRIATLHLAAATGGGFSLVIVPDDNDRQGPALAARDAARSAIGMADMLAHEIKNPLAGIRGAAQLLAMELDEQEELHDLTTLIVAESRRIVALLEQVERFGDTSAPSLQAVNLHDVLERSRLSAELSFARSVRLVPAYDPSLPQVEADPDQIVQVILNLLRNASEAMTGQADATIRIRSFYDGSLRQSGEAGGKQLPIHVEIEDNGPGLPEAIAERVFEPFVSGRENGTGLGLALVAKIAADHGAWIGVDSRPGRTVFRLSLPKA